MTRVYRVEIAPAAKRQIRKLSPQIRRRIIERLEVLAKHPRPAAMEKLKGAKDFFRVRVGQYRIIYQLDDAILRILVLKVGDRKEVYRNLPNR